MWTAKGLLVFASLVAAAGLAGCASTAPQTPAAEDSTAFADAPSGTASRLGSPALTSKAARDLTLGVSDLPAGWSAFGDDVVPLEEPGFKEGHNRGVIKTSGSGQSYVTFQTYAFTFNATPDAGAYYDKIAAETKQQFSTSDTEHGDRAIYWEWTTSDAYELVQMANVVWRIEKSKSGFINDDLSMDSVAGKLTEKF